MSKTIVTIAFVIVVWLIDWLIACGLIKLVTLCFSLNFSWAIATGIWIIMHLLRSIFRNNK